MSKQSFPDDAGSPAKAPRKSPEDHRFPKTEGDAGIVPTEKKPAQEETKEEADESTVGSPTRPPASESNGLEDDFLADLSDPTKAKRLDPFRAKPREAPDPVVVELGEEISTLPQREERVVVDLNAKPGSLSNAIKPKDPGKAKQRKVRGGAPKISRRQERKLARQERRLRRQAAKAEAKLKALEGSTAGGDTLKLGKETKSGVRQGEDNLSMDDLDMENPLPEAAYAPGRSHADLVMDRKRRRLEAAARVQAKEREQRAPWEQEDDDALERALIRKKFSLPVYLVQAILVVFAGFLLIMGLRTAIMSTKDAEAGDQPAAGGGLAALGWNEAKEVVQNYLAAPDWQTKLAFVRHPERARPRMKRYYERHPGEDGALEVRRIGAHPQPLEGGYGFLGVGELENGETVKIPVVRFEAEAPYFVVDWESCVQYADVDWVDFLEARKPGSRGIFRLYGCEDDFYAFQFGDEETFLALQLKDSNQKKTAYGYVERDTGDWREIETMLAIWEDRNPRLSAGWRGQNVRAVEKSLGAGNFGGSDPEKSINPVRWMRREDSWAPMTLEVEFPERVASPYVLQLKIVRFISGNWVVEEAISEQKTSG